MSRRNRTTAKRSDAAPAKAVASNAKSFCSNDVDSESTSSCATVTGGGKIDSPDETRETRNTASVTAGDALDLLLPTAGPAPTQRKVARQEACAAVAASPDEDCPSIEVVSRELALLERIEADDVDRSDDCCIADPSTSDASCESDEVADAVDSDEFNRLQGELAERNLLVDELTLQLEKAAIQLDRFQRIGVDRVHTSETSTPAPSHAQATPLAEDLQRLVRQWDDLQAAMTLGHLEIQVTEIRAMLEEQLSHRDFRASTLPAHTNHLSDSHSSDHASTRHNDRDDEAKDQKSAKSAGEPTDLIWKNLKAQLLGEEITQAATNEVVATLPAAEEVLIPEPPRPTLIDFTRATPLELESAISERDRYIVYLIQKQRSGSGPQAVPDWVSLEQVPAELLVRLEQLACDYDHALRMAEVELSLERGRLAREEAKLRHQQHLIDKQLERLAAQDIGAGHSAPSAADAKSRRRWFRFLGN